MTEKQKKYSEEALKVIKEHKIKIFDHIFGFTSFCAATAYNHELEKLENIKDALQANKSKAKTTLIDKWINSDNATLNVAAYRLMSSPEEHKLLNQQYHDHTSKGKEVKIPILDNNPLED